MQVTITSTTPKTFTELEGKESNALCTQYPRAAHTLIDFQWGTSECASMNTGLFNTVPLPETNATDIEPDQTHDPILSQQQQQQQQQQHPLPAFWDSGNLITILLNLITSLI